MDSSFHRAGRRWLAGCALLFAATAALAQPASTQPGRPDPLDPLAQVPAATYVSPFANYQRLGDDQRVPWSQANETVNRIGGWRAYLREANQADAAPPSPTPAAPPAPTADQPSGSVSAGPTGQPGDRMPADASRRSGHRGHMNH